MAQGRWRQIRHQRPRRRPLQRRRAYRALGTAARRRPDLPRRGRDQGGSAHVARRRPHGRRGRAGRRTGHRHPPARGCGLRRGLPEPRWGGPRPGRHPGPPARPGNGVPGLIAISAPAGPGDEDAVPRIARQHPLPNPLSRSRGPQSTWRTDTAPPARTGSGHGARASSVPVTRGPRSSDLDPWRPGSKSFSHLIHPFGYMVGHLPMRL